MTAKTNQIDSVKYAYDNLKDVYELGTYDEFLENMADDEKRGLFYENTKNNVEWGTEENFERIFGGVHPDINSILPSNANSDSINTVDGVAEYENYDYIDPHQEIDVHNDDPTAMLNLQMENNNEDIEFNKWYAEQSEKYGLDPDPDHPDHHYDYRAAFRAGAQPTEYTGEYIDDRIGFWGISNKSPLAAKIFGISALSSDDFALGFSTESMNYYEDGLYGTKDASEVTPQIFGSHLNIVSQLSKTDEGWKHFDSYNKNTVEFQQWKGLFGELVPQLDIESILTSAESYDPRGEGQFDGNAILNEIKKEAGNNTANINLSGEQINAIIREFANSGDTEYQNLTDTEKEKVNENIINALSVGMSESGGNTTLDKGNFRTDYHWPSQFKHDDHPNRFVVRQHNDGIHYITDTKNNEMVDVDTWMDEAVVEFNLNPEQKEHMRDIVINSGYQKGIQEGYLMLIDNIGKLEDQFEFHEVDPISGEKAQATKEDWLAEWATNANEGYDWFIPDMLMNPDAFGDIGSLSWGNNPVTGVVEGAMGIVSGLGSLVGAGFYSLGEATWEWGTTDKTFMQSYNTAKEIEDITYNWTYQPRSGMGKNLLSLIAMPWQSYSSSVHSLGDYIYDQEPTGNSGVDAFLAAGTVGVGEILPFLFGPVKARYKKNIKNTRLKTGYDKSLWSRLTKDQKILEVSDIKNFKPEMLGNNKAQFVVDSKTGISYLVEKKGNGVKKIVMDISEVPPQILAKLNEIIPQRKLNTKEINKKLNDTKLKPKERKAIIDNLSKELNIPKDQLIKILESGEPIPLEFVRWVQMTDKPWFTKMKKKLGLESYEKPTSFTQLGDGSYVPNIKGGIWEVGSADLAAIKHMYKNGVKVNWTDAKGTNQTWDIIRSFDEIVKNKEKKVNKKVKKKRLIKNKKK